MQGNCKIHFQDFRVLFFFTCDNSFLPIKWSFLWIREHFREVWKNDENLFKSLFPVLKSTNCQYPTDIFFLEVIPVTPPKFRPVDFTNGTIKENGRSMVLKDIIKNAEILKTTVVAFKQNSVDNLPEQAQRLIAILSGSTLLAKLHFAWEELQQSVNLIVDTSSQKDAVGIGFKQVEQPSRLFIIITYSLVIRLALKLVYEFDSNRLFHLNNSV